MSRVKSCPQMEQKNGGPILCRATDGKPCAHQRYCGMQGRWVLTDPAAECPGREKEEKA